MGFKLHFEAFSYCVENRRQVIHARIAFGRQHPMKALTRHGGYLGQSFKSQGCIHKIAQNETCRLRLATQKQSCRLIKERFSERGIALYSSNDCLLEITSQRHGHYLFRFLALLLSDAGGAFRPLYSTSKYGIEPSGRMHSSTGFSLPYGNLYV